ncbi:uncharacterized protein LOC120183006 [Hibiscus syriacus]|uniref:uncharacterized protein LOC120183006 n=1 Tax=Hibiscus syriacus TaxID=106335 RepID=UPI00192303E6|nr:uncharacterized protein LOC120183006 [Hibiscus syriacus]
MQIFQWLFKAADERGVQNNTTRKDQEDKPKEIVRSKNNKKSRSKIDSSRSTHQQSHSQAIRKMKREGLVVVSHKSDSSKVSPLSEAQVAASSSKKDKKTQTRFSYEGVVEMGCFGQIGEKVEQKG